CRGAGGGDDEGDGVDVAVVVAATSQNFSLRWVMTPEVGGVEEMCV
nr:hypothetical protein [Tanacetum cinerariifolium]